MINSSQVSFWQHVQIQNASADLLVEVAGSKKPKQGFVGPERVWNDGICDTVAHVKHLCCIG